MVVVKADGYGHGMAESARAARDAGAEWLGRRDARRGARAAGGRRHRPGPVLADRAGRGLRRGDRGGRRRHRLLRGRAGRGRRRGRGPHARGCSSRSTPASAAAAPRPTRGRRCSRPPPGWSATAGSRSPASGRTSRSSDEPDDPANDAQEAAFHEALDEAERAGLRPEVRHLANSAAAILRPSSRLDLVRVGIAAYGLDPAPGHTPDLGLVPAMTARATPGDGQARRGGRRGLLRPDLDRRARDDARAWCRWGTPTASCASPATGPRSGSTGARRPVRGRICMDQLVVDLGDADAAAGRRTRSCSGRASTASRPRRTGRRPAARSATRSSPGSAAG